MNDNGGRSVSSAAMPKTRSKAVTLLTATRALGEKLASSRSAYAYVPPTNGMLRVLNRERGADFDLDAYTYIPFWDSRMERMGLRLRSEMPHRVRIPGAGLEIDLASGEEIRVEISSKFRPEGIQSELNAAGFEVTDTFTDPGDDFAVVLARRTVG